MLYAVLFIISFTISVSVALVKRDNLSNITDVLDNSEPFYYVIYACIAITLPGIADGIFELLAPAPQEINATERIILLLSIVAPSVYAGILRFLPNTDTLQEACMYSVMKIMQKCVMIAVFLIIVVRRNEQYFRPSVATLAYILLCFAQTLRSCFLYGGVPGILGVCSSIAIWTSFGIMLTLCLRFWAFLAYNRTSKLTSENIITCFVTVLAAVVIVAINALDLALQQSTWDQYDYRDLLYGNLIFTICTLWLVTLPNYISRLLLSESQRRLEMKRLFVRHVSHEIRTPLNIATVGLSLLSKLTSREGRPDDDDDEKATAAESIMQEQMDLISEVQESCRVAVSIIDDLLAYEKLDAGLLLLDSSLENVCAFIRATSALFSIQARGKEIDFRVLQNIDCIEETSSFLIDKGKMAQVLTLFVLIIELLSYSATFPGCPQPN
jgi:signal transduction histidine kinase